MRMRSATIVGMAQAGSFGDHEKPAALNRGSLRINSHWTKPRMAALRCNCLMVVTLSSISYFKQLVS